MKRADAMKAPRSVQCRALRGMLQFNQYGLNHPDVAAVFCFPSAYFDDDLRELAFAVFTSGGEWPSVEDYMTRRARYREMVLDGLRRYIAAGKESRESFLAAVAELREPQCALPRQTNFIEASQPREAGE